MAVFILSTLLSGEIFWHGRIVAGSFSDLLACLGTQYLLNMGFCALILLLCTLTRSSAFGMTAGILMVLGVLFSVYALISRGISSILPGKDFNLSLYMLEGNIQMAGIGAPAGTMLRAVAVGLVFLIVSAAAAMTVMQKRDVR